MSYNDKEIALVRSNNGSKWIYNGKVYPVNSLAQRLVKDYNLNVVYKVTPETSYIVIPDGSTEPLLRENEQEIMKGKKVKVMTLGDFLNILRPTSSSAGPSSPKSGRSAHKKSLPTRTKSPKPAFENNRALSPSETRSRSTRLNNFDSDSDSDSDNDFGSDSGSDSRSPSRSRSRHRSRSSSQSKSRGERSRSRSSEASPLGRSRSKEANNEDDRSKKSNNKSNRAIDELKLAMDNKSHYRNEVKQKMLLENKKNHNRSNHKKQNKYDDDSGESDKSEHTEDTNSDGEHNNENNEHSENNENNENKSKNKSEKSDKIVKLPKDHENRQKDKKKEKEKEKESENETIKEKKKEQKGKKEKDDKEKNKNKEKVQEKTKDKNKTKWKAWVGKEQKKKSYTINHNNHTLSLNKKEVELVLGRYVKSLIIQRKPSNRVNLSILPDDGFIDQKHNQKLVAKKMTTTTLTPFLISYSDLFTDANWAEKIGKLIDEKNKEIKQNEKSKKAKKSNDGDKSDSPDINIIQTVISPYLWLSDPHYVVTQDAAVPKSFKTFDDFLKVNKENNPTQSYRMREETVGTLLKINDKDDNNKTEPTKYRIVIQRKNGMLVSIHFHPHKMNKA